MQSLHWSIRAQAPSLPNAPSAAAAAPGNTRGVR